MSYYSDIYLKRVNRFGTDYQSRVEGSREYLFEDYLLKSIYRVNFIYNGQTHPGSLERYKQNETRTLQYLLVRRDLIIPNGTMLEITDLHNQVSKWMVYWLEDIETSGYNRYVVLSMTHIIHWVDRNGITQTCNAYLYGQEDNMLKDELKSRSRSDTLYGENLKLNFFITALNENINKDDYFEVSLEGATTQIIDPYVVTGYDRQSTLGVEYVTVDPVYLRDHSPDPVQGEGDEDADFYWLNRGE